MNKKIWEIRAVQQRLLHNCTGRKEEDCLFNINNNLPYYNNILLAPTTTKKKEMKKKK